MSVLSTTHNMTAHWQDVDARHHLQPFTDYKKLNAKGARIITRADGVYIWDSDGNKLLDGMAELWCTNVGYGRKDLAEVARDQMQTLPFYNTFFQTSHPPVIELSELLAEVTPPHLNHAFFCQVPLPLHINYLLLGCSVFLKQRLQPKHFQQRYLNAQTLYLLHVLHKTHQIFSDWSTRHSWAANLPLIPCQDTQNQE